MSEKINCEDIKDYKIAFECFKKRFLIDKKSIFRLESDDIILDNNSVQYLESNFIKNGIEGSPNSKKKDKKIKELTSVEKFFYQLTGENYNKEGIKISNKTKLNAIEVLAHAVWLWRLPAHNTNEKGRMNSVMEILSFNIDWSSKDYLKENSFFTMKFNGVATPGISYNTNKANELAYIINLFSIYNEKNDDSTVIKYLMDTTRVDITATRRGYIENNEYKIDEITPEQNSNSVTVPNILLHLIDSDNFEPIISNDHKKKIVNTFSKIFELSFENDQIDNKIKIIKEKLNKKLNNILKGSIFYNKKIKNIWLGGIDFESKNIILHGAPGTGKTYLTEETIKARKLIEDNSEYELVQFHPSYGYEDFIEGIKPTGLTGGEMSFSLKNGVFKQMCIDAFKNLIETERENENNKDKKELIKAKTYYFIADEINRAELSRVFGELLLCLEDDKRLRIEGGKVVGTKVKLPNYSLWKKDEHVVVKTNSNDEILDDSDNPKEWWFGVPENVYFIGTMNDIDRSVDSFDMALRRRFVWKHYKYDSEPIEKKYESINANTVEKYISVCNDLNKHITSDKGFGLSDSFELGHSYFMKPKKLTQTELDRVWLEHISPLLKEYLRTDYSEKEIIKHLDEAKKIFKF